MKRLTGAAFGTLLVATSAIAALAAGTSPNASNSPQTAARNPTTNASGMAQSSMSGSNARHMRRAAHHDEMGDRITDALNLLGANGYTDIQSIEPQGGQIVAVATLNGRSVTVAVDPQTHQIVNRS
jgi:acetyl-CoA carboxylase alpha subunit